MEAQSHETGAGIAPLGFALGVVVLLVGLIVKPPVLVPVGGAIAVAAGIAWACRNRQPAEQASTSSAAKEDAVDGERFPRSRLLERATLGVGGLVAAGVALPTIGFAILPSFLGQR